MQVKTQNNSLVVVLDITKKNFDDARLYTPDSLTVKDDKGNTLYVVNGTLHGDGRLEPKYITCNAVVDGKVAVVMPMTMGIEPAEARELITRNAASALAAVAKYESVVKDQISADLAPIANVLASIEIEGEDVE